ncbi:hypothetical protein [Streptomyces sp. V3I7]|uniref:hypothetical protein n=1 Tax=Streptomyces sp. V3I7 TaxID=3042278 RepID=UPI00277FE5E4|nr:hypothetical protein [Streptomyces sp. V3I7]MDQ0994816.1 hypothetical protein [Streptomyces sp. V3I7]
MTGRPWRPEDFDDWCETCRAAPGELCRPWCDTGYTAEDARKGAERERRPEKEAQAEL